MRSFHAMSNVTPSTRPAQDATLLFLAAERSLLAWTRTCAALMGLGFIIERFGLDLQAVDGISAHTPGPTLSDFAGLALMGLSAVLAVLSTVSFRDILAAAGAPLPTHLSHLGVLTNLGIATVGMVLTVYLALSVG
jgi:putative membrane protein